MRERAGDVTSGSVGELEGLTVCIKGADTAKQGSIDLDVLWRRNAHKVPSGALVITDPVRRRVTSKDASLFVQQTASELNKTRNA